MNEPDHWAGECDGFDNFGDGGCGCGRVGCNGGVLCSINSGVLGNIGSGCCDGDGGSSGWIDATSSERESVGLRIDDIGVGAIDEVELPSVIAAHAAGNSNIDALL